MTQAAQLAQYGANNVGLSFKNRIINGDMGIDQRNNGASVTANGSTYTYQLDRFYSGGLNGSGAFTVQRVTDAPAGFSNSVRITVTTADSSFAAAEEYGFQQNIEGFNTADLNLGTANAQPVTLSFWVKSSLTGTFGVALRNANVWNRSYVGQYTISSANTWEYKTVTATSETTGTWGTGSSASINVAFDLGAGSNFNGTANTWNTSGVTRVSGNTSVISTNGATWQVTGVQLEKGTVATSFDYLPYGTELMLCQRYYQTAGAASCGSVDGATSVTVQITEKTFVPMRASPSGSIYSGVTAAYRSQGADFTAASPSIGNFTCNGNNSFWTQVNGFSGLTSNAVVTGRNSQSANNGNFIALSAEL